ERHRLGLAFRGEDPYAAGVAAAAGPRRGARAAPLASRELLVLRALLGRQDLADLGARGLANRRSARLALTLRETAQRHHLLPRVGQDRVEFLLLLGAEPEARHQPLAHLARRPAPADRKSTRLHSSH